MVRGSIGELGLLVARRGRVGNSAAAAPSSFRTRGGYRSTNLLTFSGGTTRDARHRVLAVRRAYVRCLPPCSFIAPSALVRRVARRGQVRVAGVLAKLRGKLGDLLHQGRDLLLQGTDALGSGAERSLQLVDSVVPPLARHGIGRCPNLLLMGKRKIVNGTILIYYVTADPPGQRYTFWFVQRRDSSAAVVETSHVARR